MIARTPQIPRSALVIDVMAWLHSTGQTLISNRRGGYTVSRVRPALVTGSTRRRASR